MTDGPHHADLPGSLIQTIASSDLSAAVIDLAEVGLGPAIGLREPAPGI